MPTIAEQMINAMKPRLVITLKEFNNHEKDFNKILETIHSNLKYKYETMVDKENGVIYIGRKGLTYCAKT